MNKDEKNQSSWTERQEVTEIYKKNTKSMKRKENNQLSWWVPRVSESSQRGMLLIASKNLHEIYLLLKIDSSISFETHWFEVENKIEEVGHRFS